MNDLDLPGGSQGDAADDVGEPVEVRRQLARCQAALMLPPRWAQRHSRQQRDWLLRHARRV